MEEQRKTKIVIVEDSPKLRENMIEALSKSGYEVHSATNGEEGYNIITEVMPDVVVSDIMMPGIDGYELLKKLKSEVSTAVIPVILLTAKIETKDIRYGMTEGAEDYITKPFRLADLIKAIETQLKKRRSFEKKLDTLKNNIALYLPHELRTPLNGVLGFAQMLKNDMKEMDEDSVNELVDRIYFSGKRMEEQVDKFLKYTETELIENDPMRLREVKKSVTKTPCFCVNMIARKCAGKYDREGDVLVVCRNKPVNMDKNHLQIIVAEILDNAFNLTEKGSKIYIETSKDNGLYELAIDMHGLPYDEEGNPFMPYEEGKYTRQVNGVGYFLVEKIIRLYEGNLVVTKGEGEFTKVLIRIPLGNIYLTKKDKQTMEC